MNNYLLLIKNNDDGITHKRFAIIDKENGHVHTQKALSERDIHVDEKRFIVRECCIDGLQNSKWFASSL